MTTRAWIAVIIVAAALSIAASAWFVLYGPDGPAPQHSEERP